MGAATGSRDDALRRHGRAHRGNGAGAIGAFWDFQSGGAWDVQCFGARGHVGCDGLDRGADRKLDRKLGQRAFPTAKRLWSSFKSPSFESIESPRKAVLTAAVEK